MKPSELLYNIAITKIDSVGPILGKSLISYCGSSEAVFLEKKHRLMKIPGVGEISIEAIKKSDTFREAEKELLRAEKEDTEIIFFTDKKYPHRLKAIDDAPALIYYKGNQNLNAAKSIAIVGTRQATEYGKHIVEKICEDLVPQRPAE